MPASCSVRWLGSSPPDVMRGPKYSLWEEGGTPRCCRRQSFTSLTVDHVRTVKGRFLPCLSDTSRTNIRRSGPLAAVPEERPAAPAPDFPALLAVPPGRWLPPPPPPPVLCGRNMTETDRLELRPGLLKLMTDAVISSLVVAFGSCCCAGCSCK